MGWVILVMTKLLNRREAFYLKEIGWKITFILDVQGLSTGNEC